MGLWLKSMSRMGTSYRWTKEQAEMRFGPSGKGV
jgi:hypothetical protein